MENIRKELDVESATANLESSFCGYRLMQMSPEDAREAAQIEAGIFSMPWSENSFRTSLQSKDTCYLCWRDENEMVGYCGFLQSFDEADITNVAVRSDHRGRGLGRKMLEELMKCGNQRGVSRFTLEVRKSNETALSLYQSLGFESAGIRKNFYEKPKEDAVIMWKVDNC